MEPDNTLARRYFSQAGFGKSEAVQHLCEKCSALELWRADFEVNRRFDELEKSPDCSFCRLLSTKALMLKLAATDNIRCSWKGPTLRVFGQDETRFFNLATFLGPSRAGLALDGDEEVAKHLPWLRKSTQLGHRTLPPSGSPEQYKLLRYWLQVCDTQHHHGRRRFEKEHSQKMPTRLIYVGNSQLRLETFHSSRVSYAALSHRWGNGPPFCTLDSNLDKLCRKIPFKLLPRNFQDAIRVTRALGLSYLWIDSLCIIQKNEEDWRREAARMGDVFSNAYCTIAASSATSSVEGFLGRPHQQPLFATLSGPGSNRFHVSECLENFHRDVETAPLNTRGWVFQERALSRRTLHFTKNQVYWECGNGVYSKRLIKLINPHAALLGDSNFPEAVLPFYKGGRQTLFQYLYKRYSTLDFTHITDHAVAIAGLEQRLVQTFNTRGSYGLFENYFQRSLLWHRRSGSYLERITFSDSRPVPSWSWMAYKGQIDYMDAPYGEVDWCFSSGEFFELESAHSGVRPTLTVSSNALLMSQAETDGRVRFDEYVATRAHDLRCITVGKSKALDQYGELIHYALVIAEDSNQAGKYWRVGVGWLVSRHIDPEEKQVALV